MPAAPGSNSTACTYMYNPWGACQSDSTQTRTVATSSPSGCTGTPVLSQSCTYTPPVTTVTAANVTSSCTGCHGLTSNSTVFKSGGYTVSGRTAADWLTTVNNMIGLGASLTPAGVTAQDYANFLAAQPVATTACTSFSYSAWGACQSDSTQTRTLTSSLPAGCTGGTPRSFSVLHLCAADHDLHVLHLLCLGSLPVQQYAVQDSSIIVSRRMHRRNTGLDPGLRLCPADHDGHGGSGDLVMHTGATGSPEQRPYSRAAGTRVSGRNASAWVTSVNNMIGPGGHIDACRHYCTGLREFPDSTSLMAY